MNRVEDLVISAGGFSAVARELGVTKQAVHHWAKRNRVGASRVPRFAKLVGVSPESLRPDMYA